MRQTYRANRVRAMRKQFSGTQFTEGGCEYACEGKQTKRGFRVYCKKVDVKCKPRISSSVPEIVETPVRPGFTRKLMEDYPELQKSYLTQAISEEAKIPSPLTPNKVDGYPILRSEVITTGKKIPVRWLVSLTKMHDGELVYYVFRLMTEGTFGNLRGYWVQLQGNEYDKIPNPVAKLGTRLVNEMQQQAITLKLPATEKTKGALEMTPFVDDGAGANLYNYPLSDLVHDYTMMLEDFGPNDSDVQNYKMVIDNLKKRRK